jgi:hypothetical protein
MVFFNCDFLVLVFNLNFHPPPPPPQPPLKIFYFEEGERNKILGRKLGRIGPTLAARTIPLLYPIVTAGPCQPYIRINNHLSIKRITKTNRRKIFTDISTQQDYNTIPQKPYKNGPFSLIFYIVHDDFLTIQHNRVFIQCVLTIFLPSAVNDTV